MPVRLMTALARSKPRSKLIQVLRDRRAVTRPGFCNNPHYPNILTSGICLLLRVLRYPIVELGWRRGATIDPGRKSNDHVECVACVMSTTPIINCQGLHSNEQRN